MQFSHPSAMQRHAFVAVDALPSPELAQIYGQFFPHPLPPNVPLLVPSPFLLHKEHLSAIEALLCPSRSHLKQMLTATQSSPSIPARNLARSARPAGVPSESAVQNDQVFQDRLRSSGIASLPL